MEKKRYTEEQKKFLKTKLAIETRVDDEGRRRVSVEQVKTPVWISTNYSEKADRFRQYVP